MKIVSRLETCPYQVIQWFFLLESKVLISKYSEYWFSLHITSWSYWIVATVTIILYLRNYEESNIITQWIWGISFIFLNFGLTLAAISKTSSKNKKFLSHDVATNCNTYFLDIFRMTQNVNFNWEIL